MTSPGRRIASTAILRNDENGAPRIRVLCDCGQVTDLTFEAEPPAGASPDAKLVIARQEIAFTCDGCQTSHWLRLAPPGEDPDGITLHGRIPFPPEAFDG